MWWWVGSAVALYEFARHEANLTERREVYAVAKRAAAARGKPLLVVGNTAGRHGRGDVCVDVDPEPGCKWGAVERLDSRFAPGTFGAAFCSHVLEHLADPQRGLDTMRRVADEVFVVVPSPYSVFVLLIASHRNVLEAWKLRGRHIGIGGG